MPSSPPLTPGESKSPITSKPEDAAAAAAPPPPQVSDAEAKKAANVEAKIAVAESQIADTKAKTEEIAAQLKNPNPQETVQNHIRLLHDYNELRDIGTGLMGLIADQRGVRLKEIMAEFGVGEGD